MDNETNNSDTTNFSQTVQTVAGVVTLAYAVFGTVVLGTLAVDCVTAGIDELRTRRKAKKNK